MLGKGVLTGIMRIARESIISDLNNLGVYTLLSKKFNHSFGFTENEVKTMIEDFDILDMLEQVQLWYNGYRFGGKVIYNPWSIINFLNDEDSFWSYLLMGGYLKQTAPRPDSGRVFYTLSVPNEEVKTTYQRIIRRFFTARVEPERVEIMLKALMILQGSSYTQAAKIFFPSVLISSFFPIRPLSFLKS